uniref:glycogenin glucosyltransferase n=1 Tax=Trichuris muris TaxID=70415 RepID=A0A5S6QYG1_TRIMR
MGVHADQAWVTLVTNDSYCLGALVLGHSLRRTNTKRALHCLVAPGVSQEMRTNLTYVYDVVTDVDLMDSGDAEKLQLIRRPDLGITFTKLHCWKLTQYKKCVFIDADCMVLQHSDELFDYPELSAAPDIGWPDIFNSGVFVFEPSESTYKKIVDLAMTEGSFDGGDQGVLNAYFGDWVTKGPPHRLSFVYNTASSALYTYVAALRRFGKDVKIVHFIGPNKPWMLLTDEQQARSVKTDHPESEFLMKWFQLFGERVLPSLNPSYLPKEMKATLKHDRSACNCIVCRWCPNACYLKHASIHPYVYRVTVDIDALKSIRPRTVDEVVRMLMSIREPWNTRRLETPSSSFQESSESGSENQPATASTSKHAAGNSNASGKDGPSGGVGENTAIGGIGGQPGDRGQLRKIHLPFTLRELTDLVTYRVSLAKWTKHKLKTKPVFGVGPLYWDTLYLEEDFFDERHKSAPAVLGFRRKHFVPPDPDLPSTSTRKLHVRRRSLDALRQRAQILDPTKPVPVAYRMFVPLEISMAQAKKGQMEAAQSGQRQPVSPEKGKDDIADKGTSSPGCPPPADSGQKEAK